MEILLNLFSSISLCTFILTVPGLPLKYSFGKIFLLSGIVIGIMPIFCSTAKRKGPFLNFFKSFI